MENAAAKRRTGLICLGLAVAVFAAYGQLWGHEFINYDDPDYVTSNTHVQNGLTWAGIVWAFTSVHAHNWHPLTWISHMLDCQIYGLNPAGHHLTSLLLHAAGSIFLFLALQRLTGLAWPGAFVAALFALHPAHVESVAWVAERKDVLSGLFWMLTLFFWAGYIDDRTRRRGGKNNYAAALCCFILGLLAKPIVVTLPFALLLIDYWPAARRDVGLYSLAREKAPFFVLSLASCLVTYLVQNKTGAVMSLSRLSIGARLADVPVAYVRYLGELFWPERLAVWYPESVRPAWMVAGSIFLLLALSLVAAWQARSRPWIIVGWLWFLGTLVPVIGLVQVGMQSLADRYTYIPSVGIFIIATWVAHEVTAKAGYRFVTPACLAAIAGCFVLTVRQDAYWKNSGVLSQHAIDCTANNFIAYEMLGNYEADHGLTNAAIDHLESSLKRDPNFALVRAKLGHLLLGQNRIEDAAIQLRKAISLDSTGPGAHYDLGYVLLAEGRPGEALDQFQQQVNLEPGDFMAQHNMGAILLENGLASDAIPFLEKAAQINPTNAAARYDLGNAHFRSGQPAEAVRQYQECLRLNPSQSGALNNLAWILACSPSAALRDGQLAVKLALSADQASRGTNAVIAGTLAAAYAETGNFTESISASDRALAIARAQTNNTLTVALDKRLKSYQAGKAWRDDVK